MTGQVILSEALSDNQKRALLALQEHPTLEEAAGAIGLTSRTLRRYLEDPIFLNEYRRLRRTVWEVSVSELQAASGEAVATLRANLHAESAAVQVRSARSILDHARNGLETTDLLERLENLERRLMDDE